MIREELIKRIALKMDEISSSDDVIINVNTSDNNPLYTQINSLLNESVNDVLMKAPIYRIQSQIDTPTDTAEIKTIFNGTRKIAVISVPDDFIRLASITDDKFMRPIVDLSLEGDEIDKRQHNKFLVARSAKPVAVLGRDGNTLNRIITCYSYGLDDTPSPSLQYIKRYDKDTEISQESGLDEYLIDIVSWVCAGKVFSSQGDVTRGKICDENASALMI